MKFNFICFDEKETKRSIDISKAQLKLLDLLLFILNQ